MDKKKFKKWYLVPIGIFLLFVFLYFTGVLGGDLVKNVVYSGQSGNVWCDNYKYVCCQKVFIDSNPSISSTISYTCPSTAYECEIKSGGSGAWLYSGKTNCGVRSILGLKYFKCDDEYVLKSASSSGAFPMKLVKGVTVYADRSTSISMSVVNTRLADTGTSTDANAGKPIRGSVSCGWDSSLGTPSKLSGNAIFSTTFSSSGLAPNDCALSKDGTQYLCGNIFDECSSDSDCRGYPINGNQVCSQHILQTYKCMNKNGLPSGVSKDSSGKYYGGFTIGQDSNKYSGTGKICTVDQTLNVDVGCCPGDSCGTNMFCDTSTFTCEKTAECDVASDCNTAPICDNVNLLYKTPICSSGECAFKNSKVSCCLDSNCATGESCNTLTHKCVALPDIVTACPFDCCVDEPTVSGYAKKLCADDLNCVNNACLGGDSGCKDDSECNINQECKSGECVTKTQSCSNLFGGLVPTKGLVSESSCGFLGSRCWVGSPKVKTSCGYEWGLMWILGSIFLVLLIVLFLFLKFKGKKSKR